MEKLKRVREAHTEVSVEFSDAVSVEFSDAVHAFTQGVTTLNHEPYTMSLAKLKLYNRELIKFTEAASLAAQARRFSD